MALVTGNVSLRPVQTRGGPDDALPAACANKKGETMRLRKKPQDKRILWVVEEVLKDGGWKVLYQVKSDPDVRLRLVKYEPKEADR